VNTDGGGLQQLTTASGVVCPVLAPDGSRLVYTKGGVGTYLMDFSSASKQQKPQLLPFSGKPGEWFRATSWSQDADHLAGYINGRDNSAVGIAIYSFEPARFQQLTTVGESPVWLNDGR